MQTSDRSRIIRSLALAAAVLLVGGAALGSQAINNATHRSDADQPPTASADMNGDGQVSDVSETEEASESPEASPEEDEDASPDEDANETEADDETAAEDEAETESESESETAEPSESPDDVGDDAHDD